MGDMYFDLALQQELAVAEDHVIEWLLEELEPFKLITAPGAEAAVETSGLLAHQFTQLVQVAEESESVPVVTNYLRYQIGRSEKEDQGWRYQNLGVTLIKLLEEDLYRESENAAHRAARLAYEVHVASPAEIRQAWVLLAQRFLGAMSRTFTQRRNDAGALRTGRTGGEQ